MKDIKFITNKEDEENEDFIIPVYKRKTKWLDAQPDSDGELRGDNKRIKHARDRDFGFPVGNYTQSSPMFFTRDNHTLWLGDMYRGKSAFLILNGTSFSELLGGYSEKHNMSHKKMLEYPGFVTMTMNNGVSLFRSDLWVACDTASKFIYSLWQDPKIMKFVPMERKEHELFDSGEWKVTDVRVGDCPNIVYFRRNNIFNPSQFLYENTFNWGNTKKYGGSRSTMLVAIKILYYLGCRKVYLLGADFYMDKDKPYGFDEYKSGGGVNGNNKKFGLMDQWFSQLKPQFEENDFYIYNCNPNSKLYTFDFKSFDDAWEYATEDIPNIETEKTRGMYEKVNKPKKKK